MEVPFTQTEHRIIHLTRDGKGHSPADMMACLNNPAADRMDLANAVRALRAKLLLVDQDIIAQSFGKRIEYRRMRLLLPSKTGT